MQTTDFYQTLKDTFGFYEASRYMIDQCLYNNSFEVKLERYQSTGTHQIIGETTEKKYVLATVGGRNSRQEIDNYNVFQKLSAADGKTQEETLQALQGMSWCKNARAIYYEGPEGTFRAIAHGTHVNHSDNFKSFSKSLAKSLMETKEIAQ